VAARESFRRWSHPGHVCHAPRLPGVFSPHVVITVGLIKSSFVIPRMPDKSARRVERPQGGPQGERSESSKINSLDPGFRRVDELFGISLTPATDAGLSR
jgi:hypothetical protein